MSGHVRAQRGQLKVRSVVNVSAILGAESDVSHKREVHAAAVYERGFGLLQCARHGLPCIARGIKDQRAGPGKNVRIKSVAARHGNDQGSRSLMHVGLDIEWTAGSEVLLRVSGITVVRLRGEPTVEVIAIPSDHTAGIGRVLRDSVTL